MSVRNGGQTDDGRTLRGTWGSTVTKFVALIVTVMAVALVATEYQQSRYSTTMDALEEETTALVALERSILDALDPMTLVLYRTAPPSETLAAERDYLTARTNVWDAFDRAEEAVHSDAEVAHVASARASWRQIDVVVTKSALLSDEEIVAMLAQGSDPFRASIWDPWSVMDDQLATLRTTTVENLKVELDEVRHVHEAVRPVFAATLVATLALAWFTARRMSRRVLGPITMVDQAARAMSDRADLPELELPDAVTEVQNLARTLNHTAATLRVSQGLLHTQAHSDSLTSLPNRKAFGDDLREMLDLPLGDRVAVLFIDLDDFKDVNDTLGHAAGDKLLQVVGLRLQSVTRSNERIARLGGDEFAVAARTDGDPAAANAIAERLLGALSGPVHLDGVNVRLGCSIGIAVSEPDATSEQADVLLGNADFAMYMAKSQGKHRYELHSAALHTEMMARMELRHDLNDALVNDQFELHYQPVLALDDDRILGFEALIRWQHPTRGLVPPDDFIGIAEETGAIVDIGAWVVREALATLAVLHRDNPALKVSVNVAPQQLADPGFAAMVIAALEERAIAPRQLVLEITEATAMTSTKVGTASLERLREHGVHIALDDFGTGFSSLGHLSNLPVDVIKIDRSFIESRDAKVTSTLDSIVALAQGLGLHVVAEGIEFADDLERLGRYHEIGGQGYLFARPMPGGDVAAFLAEHRLVPSAAPTA